MNSALSARFFSRQRRGVWPVTLLNIWQNTVLPEHPTREAISQIGILV